MEHRQQRLFVVAVSFLRLSMVLGINLWHCLALKSEFTGSTDID
jgi:hypothetical protein